MSENERDHHFAGFARLLWKELIPLIPDQLQIDEENEECRERIAQRAYDFIYHLIENARYFSGSFDAGYGTPPEIAEAISYLPDLTQWPGKQKTGDASRG